MASSKRRVWSFYTVRAALFHNLSRKYKYLLGFLFLLLIVGILQYATRFNIKWTNWTPRETKPATCPAKEESFLTTLEYYQKNKDKPIQVEYRPSKRNDDVDQLDLEPLDTLQNTKTEFAKTLWQNSLTKEEHSYALVMAFAPFQLHSVLNLFSIWTRQYSPCQGIENDGNYPVSLVMAFDTPLNDPLIRQALVNVNEQLQHENSHFLKCFKSVQIITLDTPTDLNRLEGAALTFFALVDRLGELGYTSFFLHEPDVLPIKKNWMRALYDTFKKVHCGDAGFWQLGSPSMCDVRYGRIQDRMDLHINGNAIYALNCPGFQDYLERVKKLFPPLPMYQCSKVAGCQTGKIYEDGYDHCMYRFRENKENFDYIRWILPRFGYTHFVINMCEDRYNASLLAQVHSDVFLVHSKFFRLSHEELLIRDIYLEGENRLPGMWERKNFYNVLKTGEMEPYELRILLCTQQGKTEEQCIIQLRETDLSVYAAAKDNKYLGVPGADYVNFYKPRQTIGYDKITTSSVALAKYAPLAPHVKPATKNDQIDINWCNRMRNKLYAWTVDLHGAPSACNVPIFREIGVVLHAEIDFDNCIFYGNCKTPRLKEFAFNDWAGFSLDPNPTEQLEKFAKYYKDNEEMRRVDFVICSHPVANCQLFIALEKPMILYPTTRLEFGRDDSGINWRLPYIKQHLNPAHEFHGSNRWRRWIADMINLHKSGKAMVAANSIYDVEYVRYHTGIKPIYLPSWCGDYDCSYGLKETWFGCAGGQKYLPIRDEILIGPYRTNLQCTRNSCSDEPVRKHPIMIDMEKALENSNSKNKKKLNIKLMSEVLKDISHENLLFHPAIVLIPYQVSTMSIFEFYRANVPLFAPSIDLLCKWFNDHDIMFERTYGWPKRLEDLIPQEELDRNIPDPNSNTAESFRHWIQYSDWYQWPHIQIFDSWEHLMTLLRTVDLYEISRKMKAENARVKEELKINWAKAISELMLRNTNTTRTIN